MIRRSVTLKKSKALSSSPWALLAQLTRTQTGKLNVRGGIHSGGIVWDVRRNVRVECPDPHAGLQDSTCSGYDLCHPG